VDAIASEGAQGAVPPSAPPVNTNRLLAGLYVFAVSFLCGVCSCRIEDSSGLATGLRRPRLYQLDCLDFGSVRAFAEEARRFLQSAEPRVEAGQGRQRQPMATAAAAGGGLRLIVNNAGVMRPPQLASHDGIDPTWQTNFLAPFLLTELLASSWRSGIDGVDNGGDGPPLRVVNVSSRLESRSKLSVATLDAAATPTERRPPHAEKPDGGSPPVAASAYSDSKRAMMLWLAARAPVRSFPLAQCCGCSRALLCLALHISHMQHLIFRRVRRASDQ
jgi:NAD(P)-dependent dehydrogenase (short-subunit alcohol dehydrogenase family)